MVDVITQGQTNNAEINLPEAGFAREEELSKRHDNLQEAAEKLANNQEVETIDPSKLKLDREIQYVLNQPADPLSIPDALPDFDYCWVYSGREGQKVWEKKALKIAGMKSGWHVVEGNMSEAKEFTSAGDTTRRIGDAVLMRILKEDHDILLSYQEYRRKLQQEGITSDLRKLGDKWQNRGFIVHDDVEGVRTSGNDNMMHTLKNRASRGLGHKMVNTMIKKGTVPGMPVA